MVKHLIPTSRFDTRFIWQDLRAAVILAPICVAFGFGIAASSNFPLQAGLVSAVVAMVVSALYGGSYIVMCGAAAALAPILAKCVLALGQGDMMLGYQRTLAVIIVTGPIMYFLGWRRLTQYMAALCAHSVTSGLLAAIAVILALGRLETFTGVKLQEKHGLLALKELFWHGRIMEAVWPVLLVTFGTFGVLAFLSFYKNLPTVIKKFPPQFWVLLLLLLLSGILPLAAGHRINIPADFWSFHRWPDFDLVGMWQAGVLYDFAKGVGTLGLVDPLETVATVLAIDQIDKYRRRSDVNRVVAAMGIANVVSGFAGGMSNIPGGAKSTMSEAVGTVTAWASLFGAVIIVLMVMFGRDILNLLPMAGLSAVIVFTVMKLCAPKKWREFWEVGVDQFAVFLATFAVSVLMWDILWGILVGVFLQLSIVLWLTVRVAGLHHRWQRFWGVLQIIWRLWSNPEAEMKVCPQGQQCDVYFRGVWLFFNNVEKVLGAIPSTVTSVRFHITDEAIVVDQPTIERLRYYLKTREGNLFFAAHLLKVSERHEDSTRYAPFLARPARA